MLLETHIVLEIVNNQLERLPRSHQRVLGTASSDLFCSTASLWEIAIKVRLRKLVLDSALPLLRQTCEAFNINVLTIDPRHVLAEPQPVPATRDPFDRLLIAQAECEHMCLLTLDLALRDHPRSWRSSE
ncbi:MAG: type II toxin-antitoxin system VapC family toxin [Hyphomicrobium sp.]